MFLVFAVLKDPRSSRCYSLTGMFDSHLTQRDAKLWSVKPSLACSVKTQLKSRGFCFCVLGEVTSFNFI